MPSIYPSTSGQSMLSSDIEEDKYVNDSEVCDCFGIIILSHWAFFKVQLWLFDFGFIFSF